MTYFPFTFLFNVPGLSNPFASSAPASSEAEIGSHEQCSQAQTDTKRLKRNYDESSAQTSSGPAPAYRRHRPPSGPPPARLVRKRGWQPSSPEPSQATIIAPSTTGIFDIVPKRPDMANAQIKGDDVEVELPPSKRRKGLTETVISAAFNTALVGAAVGLTVFRMWKDRGKETEQVQSPPPPYEEEWAPTRRGISESGSETTRSTVSRANKAHGTPSHKRHTGSVRHRQKVTRKANSARKDREVSPRVYPYAQQDGFSSVRNSSAKVDELDEMDWIGDRLAQLIEEGKRALGTEIVVESEAPEDEIDDGSGNWVEEDSEELSSFTSSSRREIPMSHPKRSCAYSVPASSTPRRTALSHSRFHSDDLTASPMSIPNQSTDSAFESSAGSTSFLSRTYEAESPSIRDSMERARAAYLQKRGLALDKQ
ncbi:uncharacterized protein FOMMEDRAFT_164421 [Fomitiporia mediterranea MF3/22]|uniref:uncharacterized protein n=1 Tax=Fomitiporia mediterranea (strain MF3/22) TaxID=694068 RepID=UPI000440887B|nr:uncharacterized protein FOMMEDRAFT_164421 [Fomitiporia mediterranea MF3/22]EJD07448.1 hypothetical protein FOMMEDRAFT_164421 [Fomitiporia mediterranea MF3/22]